MMNKPSYNPAIKDVIDSFLPAVPGVVPGKMFGFPAYYVNKKLCACIYEDGVGLKVSEEKANEMIGSSGIIAFQPYGKAKMKEWIQINREKPEDYLQDKEIFDASVRYVASLPEKR